MPYNRQRERWVPPLFYGEKSVKSINASCNISTYQKHGHQHGKSAPNHSHEHFAEVCAMYVMNPKLLKEKCADGYRQMAKVFGRNPDEAPSCGDGKDSGQGNGLLPGLAAAAAGLLKSGGKVSSNPQAGTPVVGESPPVKTPTPPATATPPAKTAGPIMFGVKTGTN